jgi:gliding motility-associated-like protein
MFKRNNPNFVFLLPVVAFLLLSFPGKLMATHQRAAEIVYRNIGGLTYEITLISYTYTPSPANAYRDYLTILWGDGQSSDIERKEKINLANDITYNRYVGQHTFAAPSTYIISCEDPNRNGGILNIPNSINTPLYIYSELVINPFLGYNNSPVLLIPPIDNGCVDKPFLHNPGAYDADGDSISYRLVPCRGLLGQVIPGYTLPPASNKITLDSISGDLFWDSPTQQGEYNIAILIEEWRNGVKIGSVERDMQIIISACNNRPPVIENLIDTCVEAGDTLVFHVRAYDPDSNDVTLTATGGPLVLKDHPATLDPNPAVGFGHVTATLTWQTVCGQVKRQPYRVFFKAIDDGTPVKLVDIKSMKILVVGPAPENLTATPMGNTITLNWDSYACQNAAGYLVYRKADSTGFQHGYCETGVPPYLGYSKIGEVNDILTRTYLDDNLGSGLIQGIKYCYMIVAYYPDRAEGYASNEACASLKKDVAVITNVSVNSTDVSNGSIYVAWSKPTELDTIQAPGPYIYIVLRAEPGAVAQFVAIDSLFSLNDTLINDVALNTLEKTYRYRIDLVNNTPGNRFKIGSSQVASSIFINVGPTDKALQLTWNNDVPWNNHRFVIYRKIQGSSTFDSIGESPVNAFLDTGLKNGVEYCYYVKSVGKYSSSGFVEPILNLSQEKCNVPVDNIPPCPPVLFDSTVCEISKNVLFWTNPYDSCSLDIVKYYLYYAPCNTGPLVLLDSVFGRLDTIYEHFPPNTIAGCYAVVAIDSVGNRSGYSNTSCININRCSLYQIPNVFTPNGDGYNDLLIPRSYTSVDHIELDIRDRWGRQVFTSTDPAILWNGTDMTTGQACSDGAYFYVCDVYENTLCGMSRRVLKGTVTILR